jgi:hypothetical protein
MFEKKITFSTQEICKEIDIEKPVPIKLNIPEWYKKLTHSIETRTVKGCIPFLETLTTGYLLKLDQDIYIKHNYVDEEGNPKTTHNLPSLAFKGTALGQYSVNLNTAPNIGHTTNQLAGSPLLKKNGDMFVHKIQNPWIIKTPPGYSCLFLPPLNNEHDVFEIIPGIVDTDSYSIPINFPFIIKTESEKTITTILKRGTPYAQIIPFKKESWKMEINYFKNQKMTNKIEKFNLLGLLHTYKLNFWNKIKWN